MDAELKAKWVEALRSGKYKQTKNRLQRDGKFCCLGVLCEVAGLSSKIEEDGKVYYTTAAGSQLGFSLPAGEFGFSMAIQNALTDMNDHGKRFKTIANWIEKYIPEDHAEQS
jgi:hypothetical protein